FKEASLCGLVCPGRQYYMVDDSFLRTDIPWIIYCLRPQDIVSDKMISPSAAWRIVIGSYGWRWKDIAASPDGRFLQSFSIVRDASLDLDDKSEFLRPTFEYPVSRDSYEDAMMSLKFRKRTPDGWVAKTYVCTNWYITNGLAIPASAE